MDQFVTTIRSALLPLAYALDNIRAYDTEQMTAFALFCGPILICTVVSFTCFVYSAMSAHVAATYHWDR